MLIIEHIITVLIPVAFVIALGYFAGKRGNLQPDDSLLLTKIVLTWIFPALLLADMATTPREQLLNHRFILATLVGMMIMYALGLFIGWLRFRNLSKATLKGFVVAFPDAAFMGIPIMQSLFGNASLYPILLLNLVASLLMIPLTTMLLDIGDRKGGGLSAFTSSVIAAIQKPLVWAPLLGIVISLLGFQLPAVADSSLKLIGQATPGVSLLCLGLIMSSQKPRLTQEIWSNAFLKNILHPVLMFGACLLFAVEGPLKHQIILLCALPSATITAMFANEQGLYESEAATTIFVGTVLSLITFSIAIALTSGLG